MDPWPIPLLSAATVPPCSSTRWRTIARPSPSPPCARVGRCRPAESDEVVGQDVGRDPIAGVFHRQFGITVRSGQSDVDRRRRRELHRVRHEVPRDLLEPRHVSPRRQRPVVSLQRQLNVCARSRPPGPIRRRCTRCRSGPLGSVPGADARSASARRRGDRRRCCACARALRWMTSRACAERACDSDPPRSSETHPRMALSGVRSSCDTIARNSSFSRLASSAAPRALSSVSSSRF